VNEEMLEILIGKYLDSEITPAEQKLLDTELQSNLKAKQLLQQWQQLHEQTEQVLTAEVLENGQSPGSIFQRAVTVHNRNRWKRQFRPARWLPMAGSLAAGLLIGIGLFSLMTNDPIIQNNSNFTNGNIETAKVGTKEDQNPEPDDTKPSLKLVEMIPDRPVEYYLYTDPGGSRYVVETPTDNHVNLATHYDDLH
jgi:hypothetical protein